jgi:hypothetical protein
VDVPGAAHQLLLVQNEFSGTAPTPAKPGNVAVFKRDVATGRLTVTGHSVVIEKPMFVEVLPDPSSLE